MFIATKKYLALIILLFITNILVGQNRRDIIIHDSIYPILHKPDKYEKVKKLILSLEQEYGKEPDLRYYLLNESYINNDIPFFKESLTDLVKNHGVNIN